MIQGLSHIGLTVSDLSQSIKYYQDTFNFPVLSDAERKGEWIDKITGIPGFHSRIVYLAVTPHRHMEMFGFFHPPIIPQEKDFNLRVGIYYCAFLGRSKKRSSTIDRREDSYPGNSVETFYDPDGLLLRVIEPKDEGEAGSKESISQFLYPVVLVANLDESIPFYRDVLGLEVTSQGESSSQKKDPPGSIRWVLFSAPKGTCLKLIQPLEYGILPPHPWRIQRVGFTHFAFGVKNLEGFYRELIEKGVNFNSPPQSPAAVYDPKDEKSRPPHLGGRVVYLTTPEGLTIEFIDSPRIHVEG